MDPRWSWYIEKLPGGEKTLIDASAFLNTVKGEG